MHLRVTRIVKMIRLPEGVVFLDWHGLRRAALHRLEHEEVLGDMLVNEVEGEKRMAQVVEDAHEEHHVERLAELPKVIDREFPKLDVVAHRLGGETRLCEI